MDKPPKPRRFRPFSRQHHTHEHCNRKDHSNENKGLDETGNDQANQASACCRTHQDGGRHKPKPIANVLAAVLGVSLLDDSGARLGLILAIRVNASMSLAV
jgi:hypothetical protein